MPGERLQVVTAAFEAWNRDDFAGAVAHFSEDVEWYPHIGAVERRVFRGRDEVAGMFRDIAAHFDLSMDFSRMEEVGDSVLVHVHAHGTGVASGAPAAEDWFQLYSFRSDEVCRIEAFDDRDQAIAAAAGKGS